MNMMQEAAGKHANLMNFSYDVLQESNKLMADNERKKPQNWARQQYQPCDRLKSQPDMEFVREHVDAHQQRKNIKNSG